MFNKSEIMRSAWAMLKNDSSYKAGWYRDPVSKRKLFAQKLKSAWANARYNAKPPVVSAKVRELRHQLFLMDCIDHQTARDHQIIAELHTKLREAA